MADKFKVGDIVQLKSGGPEMTVNSTPVQRGDNYYTQWFAGKKLESGRFPENSLKPVPPDAK